MPFLKDYLGLLKAPSSICFLRNGTGFFTRPKTKDKSMMLEIWVDRCYTPENFQIQDDDVVVDVGSNIGSFSVYAAQLAKLGVVYSLEPVTSNFEILKQNLNLNKIRNCIPIKKALTGSSGKREIFVQMNDTSMHSFYNPKGIAEKVLVDTLSLDDFMRIYHIEFIDFLKMDCEGSEYEILYNTNESIFEKIGKISMECHPLYGRNSIDSMKNFLTSKGYKIKTNDDSGILYAIRE